MLARCQARAQQLVPGVVCETADHIDPGIEAEMLCLVRPENGEAPPGRTCIARLPHLRPEPLHARLGRWSSSLGRAFGPSGWFHHVGSRPCMRAEPGIVEEYWLAGTSTAKVHPLPPRFAIHCATVGGIGQLPVVGANTASLLTVLAVAALSYVLPPAPVAGAIALVSTVLCIAVESAAARWFLSPDAREFVLDEVAGAAAAMMFLPAHASGWLFVFAFIGFRFFDILKPGIQWVERLPIPGKVVWDDLLAGLYTGLLILLTTLLLPQ